MRHIDEVKSGEPIGKQEWIYHGKKLGIRKKGDVDNGMDVYTCGFPDYNGLSKAEKRALLLPLVETIREYYKDPENVRKFEEWKASREK